MPLGRVAGIRVGANWTVAVFVVMIAWLLGASYLPAAAPRLHAAVYWTVAVTTAILLFASLLVHELSHALVARRNGVTVRAITLWMLGGITELEGEPPDAAADLRIAVVGPAASIAAAGVFAGAAVVVRYAGGPAVIIAGAAWLAVMNGVLAVFNMLPGAPLDGGRVLRALLWRRYRDRRRAEVAAAQAGRFLGSGIIVIGAAALLFWNVLDGIWLMLLGWFVSSAAGAEERAAEVASTLDGVCVADVMTADPTVAPGWITVQDFIDRVAARSRQDAFPVVGFDGTLTGLVVTDLLARIPPDDRTGLRLDRAALAVPPLYRAAPQDPVVPLFARRPLGGEVLAVVLADRRVVGMVTVSDLRRAALRRRLTAAAS
jgi:Zn-dependent protease